MQYRRAAQRRWIGGLHRGEAGFKHEKKTSCAGWTDGGGTERGNRYPRFCTVVTLRRLFNLDLVYSLGSMSPVHCDQPEPLTQGLPCKPHLDSTRINAAPRRKELADLGLQTTKAHL